MLSAIFGIDWWMIRVFVGVVLYFMCIGWMSKITESKFLGIISASILIYIAWENEFIMYFIFSLFYFNALLGALYGTFHVKLK